MESHTDLKVLESPKRRCPLRGQLCFSEELPDDKKLTEREKPSLIKFLSKTISVDVALLKFLWKDCLA